MSDPGAMNAYAESAGLPGWFGKIPALGDFVTRRLPMTFVRRWDEWLAAELSMSAEDLGEAWAEAYRQAPILCFSAAAGTIDARAWHGIVMSSYDRVGREFPLTIARAGAPEEEPEMGWKQWAVIARRALNPAYDPDGLDQALADLRGNAEYATLRAGASAWWCLYPTEEWVATPLGVYEGLPQGLYRRVLAARHPG
jgi:type VI secretion system ImpM family protein